MSQLDSFADLDSTDNQSPNITCPPDLIGQPYTRPVQDSDSARQHHAGRPGTQAHGLDLRPRIGYGAAMNNFHERLVLQALQSYGEREVGGPKRNSFIGGLIDRWFRRGADDSTTAWCAIWIAEQVKECGGTPPALPFRAKSWAAWGHEVFEPRAGAIVVLRRSGGYHVAIVVRRDGAGLGCLGGNQSGSVSITHYPGSAVFSIREAV
jgi:uncharacterized protein (TIGR02594 family)